MRVDLFCGYDLSALLRSKKSQIVTEIEGLDRDYLLKVSRADLVDGLVAKYSMTPLRIMRDQRYLLEPIDVVLPQRERSGEKTRASQYTVVVPFDGDPDLFGARPSTYTLNSPSAEIQGNELRLTFNLRRPEELRDLDNLIARELDPIEVYLSRVNYEVGAHNGTLGAIAEPAIAARVERILAERQIAEALTIPIRRRDGAPQTLSVPMERKRKPISLPTVPSGSFEPEPTLASEEYEHILDICRSMAIVIEQSPSVFTDISEEDLRTHFLIQLNGHYGGQATGETFNRSGKTDIIIKASGRNVFIAECKFWAGPRGLSDAVSQLLSYSGWRDIKTAILLFVKNKDFGQVLGKIPETVKEHESFKRFEGLRGASESRYVLRQMDDRNREIRLTVLAFHVPGVNASDSVQGVK